MKYITLFLFSLCVMYVSCSKKIARTDEHTSGELASLSSLIQKVNDQAIQSKWIQAKGQIALDGGGFFSSGNMTIRSCKDSLLWLSVSKLGFEVARGLVIGDSAFLINNYENTFWSGSVEEISRKYNVPASLKDIQDLIFPALDPSAQYILNKKEPGIELRQQGVIPKKYVISSPDGLIQTLDIDHSEAMLKEKYEDYQSIDQAIKFPYTHLHIVRQANTIHETKIKFSQVQPSEFLNTPFAIPADFKRMK